MISKEDRKEVVAALKAAWEKHKAGLKPGHILRDYTVKLSITVEKGVMLWIITGDTVHMNTDCMMPQDKERALEWAADPQGFRRYIENYTHRARKKQIA